MHPIDKDELLAAIVTTPVPGQMLVAISIRRPYATEATLELVDLAALPTSSAAALTASLARSPARADVCTTTIPGLRGSYVRVWEKQEAPDQILIPLSPTYTKHNYWEFEEHRCLVSKDKDGNSTHLQTRYIPKLNSDRYGVWYGTETRVDTIGRKWHRELKHYVVDNFGELVAVPA